MRTRKLIKRSIPSSDQPHNTLQNTKKQRVNVSPKKSSSSSSDSDEEIPKRSVDANIYSDEDEDDDNEEDEDEDDDNEEDEDEDEDDDNEEDEDDEEDDDNDVDEDEDDDNNEEDDVNEEDEVTHLGEVRDTSAWEKSELIGRGSYGSVFLATSRNEDDGDKQTVAIKSAEIARASSLIHEKRILTRISSPFVVHCYGNEIARENNTSGGEITSYNLILEYCSGGSLRGLMQQSNRGRLCETYVKCFARDILYGLSGIHDKNIVHCDIKPDNIFLAPYENRFLRHSGYVAKIGDFGLAMDKDSVRYGDGTGHNRGTTEYMAPETMSYGIVDFGVDIWAFGCTVLEMLTGRVAWSEHGDNLGPGDWASLIGESCYTPFVPYWLSVEARDFLRWCLAKVSGYRWGIDLLLNHPFLSFHDPDDPESFF